jgi:hypothetical protein
VVVTISGTTGEAGFGGAAAGPVFERVMQTALQHMGVAPDMPQDIEELIAKQREKDEKTTKDQPDDQDDVTLAEADGPLTSDEILQARGGELDKSNTADTDPDAPKVPDFVGKTVRDVMQEAAADGLEVDLDGSGLARTQSPLPGTALIPGQHIRVRFTR